MYSEERYLEEGKSSVEERLAQAEELLEDMDVEEGFWIKPFTDFDGPVKARDVGEEKFHDGVIEAFQDLRDEEAILNPGIISGRGLGYILGQVERMGIRDIDVAGEMGAVYFPHEELERSVPDPRGASRIVPESEYDPDQLYSFNKVLFDHLADHELQLMYGDSFSGLIGSACIEAYGINLPEDRFSVEDTVYPGIYDNPTSHDIQEQLKVIYSDNYTQQHEDLLSDHFEFHGDLIRFDKSLEAVKVLSDAMAMNPFIPWGFQDEGDRMTMYPKYRADPDFSYEDFENFVDSVSQDYNRDADEEVWFSTYHDFSFDYGREGCENMKTQAAERLIEESGILEDIVVTNTGDKPTDILDIEDSLFFAQEGTEAQRYCEYNDIPYIPVHNATESFKIQKELASRRQPDV